jgi:hypothetical protein
MTDSMKLQGTYVSGSEDDHRTDNIVPPTPHSDNPLVSRKWRLLLESMGEVVQSMPIGDGGNQGVGEYSSSREVNVLELGPIQAVRSVSRNVFNKGEKSLAHMLVPTSYHRLGGEQVIASNLDMTHDGEHKLRDAVHGHKHIMWGRLAAPWGKDPVFEEIQSEISPLRYSEGYGDTYGKITSHLAASSKAKGEPVLKTSFLRNRKSPARILDICEGGYNLSSFVGEAGGFISISSQDPLLAQYDYSSHSINSGMWGLFSEPDLGSPTIRAMDGSSIALVEWDINCHRPSTHHTGRGTMTLDYNTGDIHDFGISVGQKDQWRWTGSKDTKDNCDRAIADGLAPEAGLQPLPLVSDRELSSGIIMATGYGIFSSGKGASDNISGWNIPDSVTNLVDNLKKVMNSEVYHEARINPKSFIRAAFLSEGGIREFLEPS